MTTQSNRGAPRWGRLREGLLEEVMLEPNLVTGAIFRTSYAIIYVIFFFILTHLKNPLYFKRKPYQ